MGGSLAIFFGLSLLGGIFILGAWVTAWRLAPEQKGAKGPWWLLPWTIKGLIVPFLLWALMNFGLSYELQPFMPQVQVVQNKGGAWFHVYLEVLGQGLFVLGSYWASLTLGWTVYEAGINLSEEPRRNLKALCWTCAVGLFIPALAVVLVGGAPLLGVAAALILVPIACYAPGVIEVEKVPPIYARAVAKMKFGKYTEAEWEIINELERCEDDFEGWMMLAELYANHFSDLAEAERTILEVCANPGTTPSQVSIALHRLADWHLKLARNPDAARRALQMICNRCPGTHLAHMAQLRVDQLPTTAEELKEQQTTKPIPLPALGDQFDQAPAPPDSPAERRKAAELANRCVERLKRQPNHVASRDQLARLLAERLDKASQAIDQLEMLLALPEPPDSQKAEWLSLMAAWHFRYRQDQEAARKTLERLVRQHPATPQAHFARHRLQLMQVARQELAARSAAPERKPIRLVDEGSVG